MRYILILLLALSPVPAAAQDGDARQDLEDGVEMMSEGARRLLKGLMGEVDPAMRDLAERFRDWDFDGIGIDDLGRYQPPEVLPNGDIIIRRKPDAPELPEDGEEIDI
ncbi:AAA+ family ATPase [Palleronia sp. LCG004]|uniref:AAA+ family ATPase n=1 Tax=Palleronia sp. LCG004 TaxID=3079304 RepID=UPI0029434EA2|nr:AAA+ family ATPase [Palleronia sp. LCG004]WOI55346.1 AAA+ family ATPase [Palleronia sp. LCG004]